MDGIKYLAFNTQRRFGAEMEVTAHTAQDKIKAAIQAVDPNHPINVYGNNHKDYGNTAWSVKYDGSCKDKDFKFGWEVATFVGKGVEEIGLIQNVAAKFQEIGLKVNDNCSVHVHAEVTDYSKSQLGKLVAIWMKIEPILLQMVPKRRLESIYCVPMRKHYRPYFDPDKTKFKDKKEQSAFYAKIKPNRHNDDNRRLTLNICNVCSAHDYEKYDYYDDYDGGGANNYKKRMTVELRLPEGSVDPRNVSNWIKMFVRFVSLTQNRKFPEDLAPVGLAETLRLFGLHETDGTPFILSRGLWNLKVWFLERILEFTDDKALREEAWNLLEYISTPYKTYDEKEFKQTGKLKNIPKEAGPGGKYAGNDLEIEMPWQWLVPAINDVEDYDYVDGY